MSMRYPGGLIATSPVNARYPSGVWTQAQAAPYQAQNVWTRDQFWPNTTLLLQGDGAVNGAQNNTFLDSSSNNFTITRNGNTTQGAFTPYEQDGYWSNYFDGSSAALTYPNNTAFAFGTGAFTIEFWINGPSNNDKFILGGRSAIGTMIVTTGGFNSSLVGALRYVGSSTIVSSAVITDNAWHHCAIVRDGSSNITLYVDGVSRATGTDTTNYTTTSGTWYIGQNDVANSNYLQAYLTNLRIVKGTAVYTSNFTPSAAPLTAITNTSLLTCQSNRFKDNSTNAFTVTVSGSPSVQAFQPFPGATTWSGSVLGGSGYFDGTGDYLSDIGTTSSFNFMHNSSALWTWECWAYIPSPSTNQYFIDNTNGTSNQIGLYLGIESSKLIFAITRGSSGTLVASGFSTDNVPANQWVHLAITYDQSLGSSNGKFYINGVASGTVNKTANAPSSSNASNAMRVACFGSGAGGFITGYISNMRISNSVVYASAFTPPTSPVTGGALLLNFTNAGIFDSAMMNDLETVGNAQVSTSVVKYGTGSMAFDGNGDYLVSRASTNNLYAFGTGDFTIEFWLYLNSTGQQIIWDGRPGSTAPTIYYFNSALRYYTNAADQIVGSSLATGQWYHIAISRSGTSTRMFINGTQSGSTYSDSTNYTTSTPIIGADANSGSFNNNLNGYIDDLRITKGAARYITNFTPPPARLPAQ